MQTVMQRDARASGCPETQSTEQLCDSTRTPLNQNVMFAKAFWWARALFNKQEMEKRGKRCNRSLFNKTARSKFLTTFKGRLPLRNALNAPNGQKWSQSFCDQGLQGQENGHNEANVKCAAAQRKTAQKVLFAYVCTAELEAVCVMCGCWGNLVSS